MYHKNNTHKHVINNQVPQCGKMIMEFCDSKIRFKGSVVIGLEEIVQE